MSSIMRARSALTGRCEEWEVIGGLLSRAEGCWTFDARERMPRSSRLTVHAFTIAAENASTATQPPPARAGSFLGQGRLCHQVGGTAGVPSAPELLCTPRQFRLVPDSDVPHAATNGVAL